MRDYTFKDEDKSKYIVRIINNNDNAFDVEFADGSFLIGIENNEENLSIVNRKMEEQAKLGVKRHFVFNNHKAASTVGFVVSLVGVAGLGVLASRIPKVQETFSQDKNIVLAGIGSLSVVLSMPAFVKMRENIKKVRELDKIAFRNKNIDKLDSYSNYNYSLNGINSRVKKIIKESRDPFSMLHIDDYSLNDLKTIVSNVDKEEEFHFTYIMSRKK